MPQRLLGYVGAKSTKTPAHRGASTPAPTSARAAVGRSTTRRQPTVTSYTITIASNDDHTTSTTLRLEASNGGVTLTDVHLHAGNGLSTGALPAIDYGLLLQAIAPTTPTPVLTATPSVPAVQSTPAPRNESAPRRSATTTAARTTGRPTGRRAAGKPAPAAAEPAAKPGTRRGTTTAKTSASVKKTTPPPASEARAKKTVTATPAKKTASSTTGTERVYRRMPADFATVYQQAGGATATAAHYGVPRHTANGWIRRLRDQDAAATNR